MSDWIKDSGSIILGDAVVWLMVVQFCCNGCLGMIGDGNGATEAEIFMVWMCAVF